MCPSCFTEANLFSFLQLCCYKIGNYICDHLKLTMKKYYTLLLATIFCFESFAQFTSGNLVVVRVGDGTLLNGGAAARCFLDEYSPTGTFVQTVAMPVTTVGSNRQFMINNSSSFEGLVTQSGDGRYLLLMGYDVAEGSTPVTSLTSGIAPRIVARIDKNETISTNTVVADGYSGESPSSAVSPNGTDIWVSGSSFNGNGGVRYITFGGTSSVALSPGTYGRQVNIFNNQLYVSSGVLSSFLVGTVGTGTPVTSPQTITNLPGLSFNNATPLCFFMADLNAGIVGPDVLYVADQGLFNGAEANTITKYSLVGTSWVKNNSVALTDAIGLTASVNGNTVTLFATNSTNLYTLTDATGYNTNMTATLTSLATAATNTKFKGVAFAPTNITTPVTAITKNEKISIKKIWQQSDNETIVEWNAEKSLQVSILVTDMNGKKLRQLSVRSVAGINRTVFNSGTFPAGSYVVSILSGKDKAAEKFIKQ
jgi:hypothetical protein